jgi:ribonucleoside-diphosphate reductase alpha chain
VSTGCGHIYVTVNRDEDGICEIFSSLGKAGGCASAQLEAICRLISLSLRSGIEASSIVKHIRGIRCPSISWQEGHAVLSCPDAIAGVLEKQIQGADAAVPIAMQLGDANSKKGSTSITTDSTNLIGQCPDCGSLLEHSEGCFICRSCGYTKC